ncbi:hypothetical protein ANCDUO_18423 [Ancylostoma duodenale]|uniref:Uncharacterized protein n=1 Tax=Ancylostoma duodenale TaxID=51022 RepID=A0A0C2FSE7_9BILA|nr:hypothetical protein ANCDUO_18423 [Ancylostoma duodenale]
MLLNHLKSVLLIFDDACDVMAEKGFKLVATCCSGANGLAANHPVVSGGMGGASQSTKKGQ